MNGKAIGLVTAAVLALGLPLPAQAAAAPTVVTVTRTSATAQWGYHMLGTGGRWTTVNLTVTAGGPRLRVVDSTYSNDQDFTLQTIVEVQTGFDYVLDPENLNTASVSGSALPGQQCKSWRDGSQTDCAATTLSLAVSWTTTGTTVQTINNYVVHDCGCVSTRHWVVQYGWNATATGVLNGVSLWNSSSPSLSSTTDEQTSVCIPVKPSAPRGVVASPRNRAAAVTWAAPVSNGWSPITRYIATASPGGRTCATAGSARSCTITGLVNRTAYRFTVRAVNVVGTSPSSAWSAPIVAGTPTQPRTLSMTYPWAGAARVTWTSPAFVGSGPVTSYQVRWSANRGATWTPWINRCLRHFATRTHLTRGHAYLVQVRAINGSGAGPVATRTFVQAR
jgi:hypothetical protein